jgi:hypothetical protein
VNDLEGWQTVASKLDAGVPPAQAFLEAGYSDEQVDAWFGADGWKPRPRLAPAPTPPPGNAP